MKHILVLFNLAEGVSVEEYERWAREVDLPMARGLKSVHNFNIYRAAGLFGSEEAPPYQYAEWLTVEGLDELAADVQDEAMQKVVEAFGAYTDAPNFIIVDSLEG